MTALLPDGGTGYERPEWPDEALDDLARAVPRVAVRAPASTTRTTCCRRCSGSAPTTARATRCAGARRPWRSCCSTGSPARSSRTSSYLARAPDLLRAFIRFCHHERGIRPGLTEETVAAVDEFEPEYQQLIRSDRLQGPEALLAAMGVYDDEMPIRTTHRTTCGGSRPWSPRSCSTRSATRSAGRSALDKLDAEPLPDEPFAWDRLRPMCTSGSARCSISWSAAVRSCSTASTGRPAAACSRTSRRATRRSSGAGEGRR